MSDKNNNFSAFIAENFGANASYVEGLLARFQADPNSVDDSWKEYFGEMLGAPKTERAVLASVPAKAESKPAATEAKAETPLPPGTEPKAIVGPAKKIVENMEQSLTVPTATSVRSMPVKVLEENRRLINDHLAGRGRGKASFTHIIAWAIVQSAKAYPALNNGFGVVDGAPSRLERSGINLGIAIDIEKKDGSRNLLVPNIKGCEKMNFAEFFAAYNDQVKALEKSRSAAKKRVTAREVQEQLAARGVLVRAQSRDGITEERPEAYKDIDAVVEVVHGAGLATKVARLRPLAVVQG